jgi:hypothetical protein
MRPGFRTFLYSVLLLVSGCKSDPDTRLEQAFESADLVEIKFVLDGELVEGVKFTYDSTEILNLKSQVLPWSEHTGDCLQEMGRIQFVQGEETVLEVPFNVGGDCNVAWLSGQGGFSFQDSLRLLVIDRFDLVRSIKGKE